MLELLQETLCYLENHSPVCTQHLTANEAKRLRHLQIKLTAGILEQLNKTCQSDLQLVKFDRNDFSPNFEGFPETDLKLSKFDPKVVIPNIKEEIRDYNEEKVTFPWNKNLTEILHEDSSNENTLEESVELDENDPANDQLISGGNAITLELINDATSEDGIIRCTTQQITQEEGLEEDDYQEDDDEDYRVEDDEDYRVETKKEEEIVGEDEVEENDDEKEAMGGDDDTTFNDTSIAADEEEDNKIISEEVVDGVMINEDDGQEEETETPPLEEDPFAEIFEKLQKKKRILDKRRKRARKLLTKPPMDEEIDWQPSGDEERETGVAFYKCTFCYRRFTTDPFRKRHEQRYHFGKNPYKCQKCGEEFEYQTLLREHFKTHAGEPEIEMMDADENIGRTEEVVVQENDGDVDWIPPEEPKRMFQCNLCYMKFTREEKRELHIKRVHLGEDPFKCDECGEAFPFKGLLEKHVRSKHRTEKIFKCHKCNKGFVSPGFLNNHILTGVCATVTCDVCGKQVLKRSLSAHKQRHEAPKLILECELCDKKFTAKYSLQSHINIVHNKQRFMCDVCGNSYVSKSSLTAHMFHHTGNLPFQCEICSKQFTVKGKLKQHINVTHATTRPYACDFCDKRFKCREGLKSHAVLHTGNKKVQCDICARKFYRHANMLKHRKIHAKEQPPTS